MSLTFPFDSLRFLPELRTLCYPNVQVSNV